MQESPTGQESFFSNFRNDNQMQSPLEAKDGDDVNSIWADVVTNEESRHNFLNSSTKPKSMTMVYEVVSSKTNAKVVSNLHGSIHFGEFPTPVIFESSCHPKPEKRQNIIQDNFEEVATSSCDSNNAVSQVEALKKLGTVRSEKNVKIVPNQSSDVNKNGSFIYMEPISPNQSLFPRSVCLVNVVIGILLLIVISWEVLSC
ncbi:hypothetical protein Fmac_010765 [Flemingia macrophylla]|uniref:Uncharacterized protein n=1 Tax=Flemingia macrophylla TaxID=520843 RepID=A0ABD1MKM0_9FABA